MVETRKQCPHYDGATIPTPGPRRRIDFTLDGSDVKGRPVGARYEAPEPLRAVRDSGVWATGPWRPQQVKCLLRHLRVFLPGCQGRNLTDSTPTLGPDWGRSRRAQCHSDKGT